jgi:hypothetical protein
MDKYVRGKVLGKGSFGVCSIVSRKSDGKNFVVKEIDVSRMPKAERETAELEAKVGNPQGSEDRTMEMILLAKKQLYQPILDVYLCHIIRNV